MELISLILATLSIFLAPQNDAGYQALKVRAEASYAEKSFGRAHAAYEEASKLELSAADRKWVELRLADTAWRSDAASPVVDPTAREKVRADLEELIRKAGDDHDRIWAEAQESLGDFLATHPQVRDAGSARQYYAAALDWWAGSDDLPLARQRYLTLIWRMTTGESYGNYGRQMFNANTVSRQELVNAVAIADTVEDRDRARMLLALQMLNERQPESSERAMELLAAVIADGKASEWYDDALYTAAMHLSREGAVIVRDDGNTAFKPDYVKALDYLRRLVTEFTKQQTRYFDEATSEINSITKPSVTAMVPGNFLPGSDEEFVLSTRNVKKVELTLTPVDLTRDMTLLDQSNVYNWLNTFQVANERPLRRWTYETKDAGDYAIVTETLPLTPRLEPGVYVLVARAGESVSRQLVLVSDATIVTHAGSQKLVVYAANVLTGEPLAGAEVRVWRDWNGTRPRVATAKTNADGIAEVPGSRTNGQMLVLISRGSGQQAWEQTYQPYVPEDQAEWRIYAFTDRPAYRPEETVKWKFIARTRERSRADWNLPTGSVHYEIYSPRNEKVAGGTAKLNAFGTFWSELPLSSSMPLGEYSIQFTDPTNLNHSIGTAQLFRLEEYKLPEFRVSVTTPEENGKRKQYRLGDSVEATIEANYYFGGAVANATVEAVVRQAPYVRYWYPWREYEWYYDSQREYPGQGQEVKRETLKTDANGRAVIRIDTARDGNDMIYSIEARVVDASRREVSGVGTVRVTRQRYAVTAYPEHYIHRPGARVEIDFRATDANDQPVQTTGMVKVMRRVWREVWLDPAGHEVTGAELERLRGPNMIFPPPQEPDLPPWRQKFAAYRDEEVESGKVTTDAKGEASYTFTPKRDGYYLTTWTSDDGSAGRPVRARDVVRAETAVWVSDRNVSDFGYHAGGLEIILDKETFRAGQTAPVMIVTPASGRWVLFSTAFGDAVETQLLHLDGTVKLVQVPITTQHVPDFVVTASSVFNAALATDTKRIVVPPVEHFVKVDVKPDREEYQPREQGSVTITTRDVDGKPVAAEVALSVSDESVTAIQSDPAGDPRQYFFAERGQEQLAVGSTLQSQRYLKLPLPKRNVAAGNEDRQMANGRMYSHDGGIGVPGGVAENLTVTASAPMAIEDAIQETKVTTSGVSAEYGRFKKEADGGSVVVVRSDFRSTAFWQPDIVTDSGGTATVSLKYPEALTTWRATARAATVGSQFGMGTATSRTKMPLIVRLEAPRFFVAGDRATISAVINNNTSSPMRVVPSLEVEGLTLVTKDVAAIDVAAAGEARADWIVTADQAGPAKLRVSGRAIDHSDAPSDSMEKSFTVYEHGIDKLIAHSGKLRGDEAIVRLELPAARRATNVSVQIAPSLAVTMLDALPYLIDYPYGCTEQTMSRFLPAAIVARTLRKNGLDPEDIEGHLFGGIEQQYAGTTHRGDKQNLARLDEIADRSMKRLYDFQHADGGWGWWKDGDSDAFMTAYVVWGFAVAREGGLGVDEAAVNRAAAWLDGKVVAAEGRWDDEAWMLHALAAWRRAGKSAHSEGERKAFDDVWKHRERLSAYSRALLALAAHDLGDDERARVLVRNLEDGVQLDRAPDRSILLHGSGSGAPEVMATAHWGQAQGWWRWYESPVETTAFVLQALVTIDPKNSLIEPTMNWLVKNRRGAQWNNTRDTAISLLGLNDYLQASGELAGDIGYELSVNGRVIATKTITAADVLRAPSRFQIDPLIVRDGMNEVRIRRTGGRGTSLYFAAEGRFVSLEEPVKAAGNELFVRRDYFRMAPHATLLKGNVYERMPLLDNGSVDSGDRVEVVLTIETKNDYDYLMFEDLKPAGLEAVALQSGTPLYANELRSATVTRKFTPATPEGEKPTVVRREAHADQTGRMAWVYQELRDRKVALFIDHLPQGVWEIRYALRAEVPGAFHALPVIGQAMYVPEVRGNGDEVRVVVK